MCYNIYIYIYIYIYLLFPSSNILYDNRCNQLEKQISDRNYKEKLVREQICKATALSRETLFNNERNS